ncbi:phage tail assembly protein [Salmonella enterica subsp. diarizonae]|nr:phage tail assembly protein [Salmonella enterica subsp. diarizonae]
MMILKNISRGSPKTPEQADLANKHKVVFMFSQDGQDWYECQKLFSPDTIKVAYDNQGIIRCISKDVSAINPEGFSVAEVPNTTANRRADISGRWGFDGTNIIDLITPEKAREQKTREIDAWRNSQENANYVFQFNNHNWDYGKATQERLTLSVQMAKANKLPDGFIWTDADNNDIPMTSGELINLSDAIDQAMFTMGAKNPHATTGNERGNRQAD